MSNTQPRPVMALAPGAPGQKRNLQRTHGGHVHALVSTLAFPHTAHAMPVAPLPPKPLPGAPLPPFPFAGAPPFATPLPFPLPLVKPLGDGLHAGELSSLHVIFDLLRRVQLERSCDRCFCFCLCEEIRLPHVELRLHFLSLERFFESGGLQFHLSAQLVQLHLLLEHVMTRTSSAVDAIDALDLADRSVAPSAADAFAPGMT